MVEEVLQERKVRNQTQYLIKWEGYDHSENIWEPTENLNCPDLLRQFHQQNLGCPRKYQEGLRRTRGR